MQREEIPEMDRRQKDPWQIHMETEVAEIKAITNEVKEILIALRGALKVLGWVGKVAKWSAPFVTIGGVLYGIYTQVFGHK